MGRARQDDVDMGDIWREYRRAQQERRASRLGPKTQTRGDYRNAMDVAVRRLRTPTTA